jgi:hypothetical protein
MIQKKKILLSATILFALHTHTKGQTFGRYADCTTGRGICGIGIENMQGEGGPEITNQKFMVEYKNDSTLQLRIVKANIELADEFRIFGSTLAALPKNEVPRIYIDLAVPVSEELRNRLGIPAKYTSIAAGVYVAAKTAQYYITELKLH